jgi:hypothetical protein
MSVLMMLSTLPFASQTSCKVSQVQPFACGSWQLLRSTAIDLDTLPEAARQRSCLCTITIGNNRTCAALSLECKEGAEACTCNVRITNGDALCSFDRYVKTSPDNLITSRGIGSRRSQVGPDACTLVEFCIRLDATVSGCGDWSNPEAKA